MTGYKGDRANIRYWNVSIFGVGGMSEGGTGFGFRGKVNSRNDEPGRTFDESSSRVVIFLKETLKTLHVHVQTISG